MEFLSTTFVSAAARQRRPSRLWRCHDASRPVGRRARRWFRTGALLGRRQFEVAFRGDVTSREFIAFWLKDGRVVAGMNVNVWEVTDHIQTLIRARQPIDRSRLLDADVPLAELLAQPTTPPAQKRRPRHHHRAHSRRA